MNKKQLRSKVGIAFSALLKEKGYISFVDLFMKLGYLDFKDYERWRMKQIPYLEKVIKVNLGQINFIMKTVRETSKNARLEPRWTGYKSWGKTKKVWLRFSKNGDRNIENHYSTHYVKIKPKA